jgi:putative FmdB family regulatory protein
MPTYEYRCEKCNRKFALVMSISEHDRRRPKCPKCGSGRVTQMISAFFAQTGKKS